MLVSLTGLPGVGKTTIARQVAQQTGALWLWIDAIETAMRGSHMRVDDMADGGYAAAQAVARTALLQGYDVIADCVNADARCRAAWRDTSQQANAQHLDGWVSCSDAAEHRHRVETRGVDLAGWVRPDWQAVTARDFEPPDDAAMHIDTAQVSARAASERIGAALHRIRQERERVRDT